MTALEDLNRTLATIGLHSPYSTDDLTEKAARAYKAIRTEVLTRDTIGRRVVALERAAYYVLAETHGMTRHLGPLEASLIDAIRDRLEDALTEGHNSPRKPAP